MWCTGPDELLCDFGKTSSVVFLSRVRQTLDQLPEQKKRRSLGGLHIVRTFVLEPPNADACSAELCIIVCDAGSRRQLRFSAHIMSSALQVWS